jgi:hypothetical protein
MARTLFLSRKLSINTNYHAMFTPVSTFSKLESKLPHTQASDDDFGKKVWDWNLDAMTKAGAL